MIVVITQSSGDVAIWIKTEEAFLQELQNKYWGDSPNFLEVKTEEANHHLFFIDPNHWPDDTIMVIRGDVIQPRPKIVTKIEGWEL